LIILALNITIQAKLVDYDINKGNISLQKLFKIPITVVLYLGQDIYPTISNIGHAELVRFNKNIKMGYTLLPLS
jgi:hypothetical protein